MKLLMPVLLAAFLLVGCERLEGQLNISKDLKLVNSKGDAELLRVGTYSADLRMSTFGKKIVLRLNNNPDEKFNFRMPEGAKIPSNGTFRFSAAQIGQNVDLSGLVRTVSTDGPVREAVTQCTYTEPVTVCYPGPYGQPVCSTQMRTVYGQQWTRYYDRTSSQDFSLSIAAAGSSVESAQFTGENTWVDRMVISQMPCR